MGNHNMILVILISSASLFFLPQQSLAGADHDLLAPLLPPSFNVCAAAVCGQGTCSASSNHPLGFVCECNRGWRQFHIGDSFRFSPCTVPNCTLNASCTRTVTPAPASLPEPSNHSFFDACYWAYCGEGSCQKTSGHMGHRCQCNEGYSNLFNDTSYPCFSDCSLGADCVDLGIGLGNRSSSSSPPNLSESDGTNGVGSSLPGTFIWSVAVALSVAVVSWT